MIRKILYLTILIQYIIVSFWGGGSQAMAAAKSGAKTEVKATIPGRYSLRIYGYTSAYSLIQALGVRVFAQGTSDKTGYFMLEDVSVSSEAREICVSSIDEEKRVSFPLCVSLPETNKDSEIGPLLLAPTLTLSNSAILQNQQEFLSGTTIPETEVVVSFFEVSEGSTFKGSTLKGALGLVKEPKSLMIVMIGILKRVADGIINDVEAVDLPTLSSKSDSRGRFSVSLPTANAVQYRLFVKAFYNHSPTPKSQTLFFSINPLTEYLLNLHIRWLILMMIFLIIMAIGIYIERRTFIGRTFAYNFIEKKWKPFAVRKLLRLRRLRYNFQQFLRSHQK